MKKLIILILILSLLLGVFASCSEDAPPIDDLTVDSSSETSSETLAETKSETNTEESTLKESIGETTTEESTLEESISETTTEIFETQSRTTSENDGETLDVCGTEETSLESISGPNITFDVLFGETPEHYGEYTLKKIGDDYYIITLHTPRAEMGNQAAYDGILFNSFDDFYKVFNENKLETNHLDSIVKNFEKDEIGYKILDFNNLYYPVLPENVKFTVSYFTYRYVYWDQWSYRFKITTGEESTSNGQIEIFARQEEYLQIYNSEPFRNAELLKQGDKTVLLTKSENNTGYYYKALIYTGEVYAFVKLQTLEVLTDNNLFLELDFEKYIPAEN